MQESFRTRQIAEYKTLSNGERGCLVFVAPDTIKYGKIIILGPTLFFLHAPWREDDKAPFLVGLHEKEKQSLKQSKELLMGYPAWLVALAFENSNRKEFPSFEDYRNFLPQNVFWYRNSEAISFERTRKNYPLLEEIIGKETWRRISYKWASEIVKHESSQYRNENYLKANGEFDYKKALWDNSWDTKRPLCRINVDTDRWVTFTMGYSFPWVELENDPSQYLYEHQSEWEEKGLTDGEKQKACEELYEDEQYQYQAHGFIVALMNLARNFSVYNYSPSHKFYQSDSNSFYSSLAPDLRIDKLNFDFEVTTKTLCEIYLNTLEESQKFEEEKKPEVLNADITQIDIDILKEERIFERWYYADSEYPNLFSEEQNQKLKSYCKSFQKYLINKIGYDPEEIEKEEPEKQRKYCIYININGIERVGVKSIEEVEEELRKASMGDAPTFVDLLREHEKIGYLDFKGHKKILIYNTLKEHFGNMNYTYKNFVAYF